MNLIAVTDIFGYTKAFDRIINQIAHHFVNIYIVDPYNKKEINFQNELEAYAFFQKNTGVNQYIEILDSVVHESGDEQQLLLGFSVGATAVWAISEDLEINNKVKGICFYSSQIRNFLEVNPQIDIELYFSSYEPSYDVEKISLEISEKQNVQCFKTSYLHGFMNEKSENYDQEGYLKFINIINKSVTNQLTRTAKTSRS